MSSDQREKLSYHIKAHTIHQLLLDIQIHTQHQIKNHLEEYDCPLDLIQKALNQVHYKYHSNAKKNKSNSEECHLSLIKNNTDDI